LTTPQEKLEDKDLNELEGAAWYKNAFDLKSLNKSIRTTTNRAPEALFDLDATQSIKTIHNRHLKPSFIPEVGEDDESEAEASAANASSATPPRKITNKEVPRNTTASAATASPLQDEVVGKTRAASSG
jgi:hypothetical protein